MGDHKAKYHSSHPLPVDNPKAFGCGPQSRFLEIGTFGHGQNKGYDQSLNSSSSESSEKELQFSSSTAVTDLSDTINAATLSNVLEYTRKALEEQYQHLKEVEKAIFQNKSLTKKEQESQKLKIRMSLEECVRMDTADENLYCPFEERSSWIEHVKMARLEEKERYLCISDGVVIYCLDLKSKDGCLGQKLPKTYTLNLLEEGSPVSMGLFKLGSGAYMVGGQEFPKLGDLKYDLDKHGDICKWLYEKRRFKGLSNESFHLVRADGSLFLSKCKNIPLLKKPKFWPIVERIGDEIHVMESFPPLVYDPRITMPSHEVLNLKEVGRGWIELSSMCYPSEKDKTQRGLFIKEHMVVGNEIYALDRSRKCFVFDSKTRKWECLGDQGWTKHVGSVLYRGKGICSGQLLTPAGSPPDHPVYVVIEIGNLYNGRRETWKIEAEAHLVNRKREIVWSGKLPHLFEGLEGPWQMLDASLFQVEEEQDGKGATICAVVLGRECETNLDFLCISTFTVEQEAAAIKRPSSPDTVLSSLPSHLFISSSSSDTDDDVKPPKFKFSAPKVVVKGWQIYELDSTTDFGMGNPMYGPRLSGTCFL